MLATSSIPDTFKADIDRAVQILKEEGCTEIYVFGSVATGEGHSDSDIDLAVRGCPPGRFFHTLGRLIWELDRSIDLVDLDSEDPFALFLEQKQRLSRIV
ncbi:MAG: nucleotidyltransferase domain-containing protein [Roseiflexaceae bacterium]